MSAFTVTGRFQTRDGEQAFERDVEAPNEDVAEERVYSLFGAEHNLKRTEVTIEAVEEVAAA